VLIRDDLIERIARIFGGPCRSTGLDGRVMRDITALPTPGGATPGKGMALAQAPPQFTLTPLGGSQRPPPSLWSSSSPDGRHPVPCPTSGVARLSVRPRSSPRDAHIARRDFNDWDATRTPMRRPEAKQLWTTVVPLPRDAITTPSYGRLRWLADPRRPGPR